MDDGPSKLDPLEEKPSKVESVDEDATVSVTSVTGGSPLNNYPLVRLDADIITDSMAGRLATSLLGHILFLKNQIPFPVMRLERIPRSQNTNARVDKQRTELLASFDTIASHMDTTFSALSTALSRCPGHQNSKTTRAYLAFLVGPSLTSAKSKVVLGIDGLEKRIWGNHTDVSSIQETGDDKNEKQDLLAETEDDDSGEDPDDSESDESEEELEEESEDDEDNCENVDRASPPPAQHSYASEQKKLQNAERLLSRILAAADGDGRGIISEMSPTQTHILIRAPRRFNHPAWIPRQNVSTSLDSILYDFLDHSGVGLSPSLSQTKHSKKNHVEGVWITTRAGIQKETTNEAPANGLLPKQEDDDMIWWSWEGKLVGFSDW
ncbi:hypothetical protein BYT27DRAFT_7155397 [Phlegmacium glaucopus]|nr:hypothetical protein BYT27DRAFT_7155397 [Phlegmacium glaucopus]